MFFTSRMGSRHSWMAPWTPWIDIKIQKKKLFFSKKIDIGPLFSYKRSFNTIIRCRDPSRIIENCLEFNPVLICYFSSYRMPVQAWTRLDISILLINLSWIAQMMLGPI